MSGQPARVGSQFIPPPLAGLDLISSPASYDINNATQLDNYFIYDWGIRERGPVPDTDIPASEYISSMFPLSSVGYSGSIIGTETKLYRYSGTTLTLLGTPGAQALSQFAFNRNIFVVTGSSSVIARYNLDTDTYSGTSYTLSGTYLGLGGFAYRNRPYVFASDPVSGDGAQVFYGTVGQVTGALAATFNFGQIFQRGRNIRFGCSWSFNEGLENRELMVIGNEAGEVLVYDGTYPGSDSFRLVTRVDIPIPVSGTLQPAVAIPVGQDIYILTKRGVISLAQVIAGKSKDIDYYLVSRNVGAAFQATLPSGAISRTHPFMYFPGANGKDLYVLNYERGAWSKFPSIVGSDAISAIVCQPDGNVLIGRVVAKDFLKLNQDATTADSSATYVWKTPYVDFGNQKQKHLKMIRVVGRDNAGASISNSVAVSTDIDDGSIGTADLKTTTVSSTDYKVQELAPPALGKRLSFKFSKTGSGSAQNEIAGFDAVYEEGGLY